MESLVVKEMLKNPPDGWVLLEDTAHAYKYAGEIWEDEPKYLDLENQYKQFQELFSELNTTPFVALETLAEIAFQVQFLRECIQEIHKLIETRKPSMFK